MILNKLDIKQKDYKVSEIVSPFGPLIMKGSLDEPIRKDILKDTNKILHTKGPSDNIVYGSYNIDQDQTIKSGKMKSLDKLSNDSYIVTLIDRLCIEWYQCACYNMSQESGKEIIENFNSSHRIITSIWSVLMKEGDWHISHNHSMEGAMISGGIYLNVPDDIKSPGGDINWIMTVPGYSFRADVYKHTPKTGEWIIWPAWLQHHVYPFRSNGERIMISFNAKLTQRTKDDK